MRIDSFSRTVPFLVFRNQQGPHIGLVCYALVDKKILTVMQWRLTDILSPSRRGKSFGTLRKCFLLFAFSHRKNFCSSPSVSSLALLFFVPLIDRQCLQLHVLTTLN